jgi:signal transduction histidine kinase
VLASLAAVALISSRVVRVELNQLTHVTRAGLPEAREQAARDVALFYRRSRLDGMTSYLARLRDQRFPGSELLLLDPQRRLLATSSSASRNVEISDGPNGAIRIRFRDGATLSEILVRGRPLDVVVPGEGVIGSLLFTPSRDRAPRDPMRVVNRWLLLAVALVGAAALAFTALVARRVIAPIERLQQAAARVRGGALDERVEVTSNDEVGQLAGAFNAMTASLQQQEELRRNMVNDVAHELRTPLTNLRASIEAIQDGLRAADPRVIDSLHDDVVLLQRLVDDLQTLALAEAGKLPLHVERVEVREELARFTEDPRVRLRVEGSPKMTVDRVRLQQILSNLVRNALTHTQGAVVIGAAEHDGKVRITVEDEGAGIAAADLPHIFDRFYRADASRTRSTGGAGLGLAIARNLVELHGGTIAVESADGGGTKFTVII